MQWKGKVIGGVIGAFFGPIGALAGAVLGHQYDVLVEKDEDEAPGGDPSIVSAVFFRTAFAVMGCVAKSDGRVSESEIAAARAVMQQLRLSAEQVQAAIRFFSEGKQPEFNVERTVKEMRNVCRRHDLLRMFVEIQLRAAVLANNLELPQRRLLQRIAQWAGVSAFELAHLEVLIRIQQAQASAGASGSGAAARTSATALSDAYRVLEISATASDAEVTRAYRRQMSRHHPDKLVANGLPESMMEVAKERTQQIREAYETICARRGMR
jgi:DnaJ like chaperone protein